MIWWLSATIIWLVLLGIINHERQQPNVQEHDIPGIVSGFLVNGIDCVHRMFCALVVTLIYLAFWIVYLVCIYVM
jgi:hypothetical protein